MRKVFWDDPYKCRLTTKIASIDGNKILPEETIIFSFSGGQESDRAFINQIPVVNSEIESNLIYYTVQGNHSFKCNDSITMEIDWLRRYRLMRLHFAAELVLEIVTRNWSLEKIGAHIAEDKSRIDFTVDKNISSYFDQILAEYNIIIDNNMAINTGFSNIDSQKRFWKIEGFSKVACGGTHVKSTAEVGYVSLKRKNIGKAKERIEITLVDQDKGLLTKYC
jgi:Ser-tRNA(Ala) deacylase AlaX